MKILPITILSTIFLVSCAGTKEAENLATIDVVYSWQKHHECSIISPQLNLSGVPERTTQLKVNMRDLDSPAYPHGGGTVDYSGSGIIEEGALNKYQGPCPPNVHRYVITVIAQDENGVSIGKGKQMHKYPPE